MVHVGILKFQPSGKDEREEPSVRRIPPEEMAERKKVAEMRAHIEAEAAKMQAAEAAHAVAAPGGAEQSAGVVPAPQPAQNEQMAARVIKLVPVEHDPFADVPAAEPHG